MLIHIYNWCMENPQMVLAFVAGTGFGIALTYVIDGLIGRVCG